MLLRSSCIAHDHPYKTVYLSFLVSGNEAAPVAFAFASARRSASTLALASNVSELEMLINRNICGHRSCTRQRQQISVSIIGALVSVQQRECRTDESDERGCEGGQRKERQRPALLLISVKVRRSE